MSAEDAERARQLVLRHGWNATAYQILNPGIALWFAAGGDAVIGYVRRNRVRVVAGAPVCAAERLRDVTGEFAMAAQREGDRVCYFGAGERLEEVLRRDGACGTVGLGAQPSWDPRRWSAIVARRASLRAQLHRARNKGIAVSQWNSERAENNPELAKLLGQWLRDSWATATPLSHRDGHDRAHARPSHLRRGTRRPRGGVPRRVAGARAARMVDRADRARSRRPQRDI